MSDIETLIKDCENWANNHKNENFLLTYSSVVELLEILKKEREAVAIKKTKDHVSGLYGGICPECHNWIPSIHSFCGFCGQTIKWDSEEV